MILPDFSRTNSDTRFPAALKALRNPGFLKSAKYQEQQARANREGADPDILDFSDKLVKRLAALHIPVFPLYIVRTYAEQEALFYKGASKDSPHDWRWPHMAYAVDIIHSTLGYMDKPVIPHGWDVIVHVAQEVAHSMGIKIVCGHHWGWKDSAHFELADWRERASAAEKRPANQQKADRVK